MPVDGRMIPLTQPFLPWRPSRESMIDGGSNIRTEHTYKVEDDTCRRPAVTTREAEIEEDSTKSYAQEDATRMTP